MHEPHINYCVLRIPSVGELVALNMLAGRVVQPVLRLAQMWQDFHQARISVARLGDCTACTPGLAL